MFGEVVSEFVMWGMGCGVYWKIIDIFYLVWEFNFEVCWGKME